MNGSGHLHWRFSRTGWLLGSIASEHMDEALQSFATTGWRLAQAAVTAAALRIAPAGVMFWHGLCRKVPWKSWSFGVCVMLRCPYHTADRTHSTAILDDF